MNERAAKCQLLLHTSAKLSGLPLFEGFDLYINIPDQIIILLNAGAENGSEELKVLFHGQVLVQREAAWHIADLFSDLQKIFHHIAPVHFRSSSIGKQKGREYAKNGSLACTIRTNETKEFTFGRLKRNPFYRCKAGLSIFVPLHQLFGQN